MEFVESIYLVVLVRSDALPCLGLGGLSFSPASVLARLLRLPRLSGPVFSPSRILLSKQPEGYSTHSL